jgi:sulfite exporter TauE/SafE
MEYILLFVSGLLSSMHCLGMCGCFVTAYSVNLKGNSSQKAISHLLYSFGRITTYSFLGAIMGFIGSNLYFLSSMAGVQNYVTIFAGVMMVWLGLSMSGILPKIQFLDKLGSYFLKYSQKYFNVLMKKQGMFFTYPLGVILGFLPCCLLYTVELQAMMTGSPLKGALSMFAFGLGTIPAMFSFGMIVNIIDSKTRAKLLNFGSYILVFLGLSSIYRVLFT